MKKKQVQPTLRELKKIAKECGMKLQVWRECGCPVKGCSCNFCKQK